MKLYYYQPDGHGPASFFVTADSKESAVTAINSYRNHRMSCGDGCGCDYYYGRTDLKIDDIEEAGVGTVIENAND